MANPILCAHCKDYHPSIADVKQCASVHNAAKVFSVQDSLPLDLPVPPARPAHITLREQAKRDAVPPGRYAVYRNEILGFFKVDRPTEGRWVGHTFVSQVVSDKEYRLNRAQARYVLNLIAEDPREAMIRYGREIGSCGHCGRTLTNATSRAAGIGPVCAGRMGW